MADNRNKRKRYLLLGALAVLASALGVERCAHEEPEDAVEVVGSHGASPAPADTSEVASPATPDILPTHRVAPHGHPFHRRHGGMPATADHPREREQAFVAAADTAGAPLMAGDSGDGIPAIVPPQADPLAAEGQGLAPTPVRNRFPHAHHFRLGIHAGLAHSTLTGLGGIVEAYDTRPTFTMDAKGGFAPRVGIFGSWQHRRLGAELGVAYTRLCSTLTERKAAFGVTETTDFHHDVVMPQLLFRVYAFPSLYMAAGASVAIPLGGRQVDFHTDRDGQAYRQQDEHTQQHLRETLHPHVLLSPTLKLGYADGKSGLEAGVEYSFGANDFLHTRPNDYGYQERRNHVHLVTLTVGYSIPLNKKKEQP